MTPSSPLRDSPFLADWLSPVCRDSVDSIAQIRQLSPLSLAYLGDAVYELFMRTAYLCPPKRMNDYHRQVVRKVRAESQAECLQALYPYLTDAEKNIVRQGRNASPRRTKRVSPELYQQATSLETLIGYLYLYDLPRLQELLDKIPLDSE